VAHLCVLFQTENVKPVKTVHCRAYFSLFTFCAGKSLGCCPSKGIEFLCAFMHERRLSGEIERKEAQKYLRSIQFVLQNSSD
jgi:hypothetical protein